MRLLPVGSCIHLMLRGRTWNGQLQLRLLLRKCPTSVTSVWAKEVLCAVPQFCNFSSTITEAGASSLNHSDVPKETEDVDAAINLFLLQSKENGDWNDEELKSLFSSAKFTPTQILMVIRGLGDSNMGLRFFEWSREHLSLSSSDEGDAIDGPSAYQAMFELASKEQPNPHLRMLELLQKSRKQGYSLTLDSASMLIHYFGRAGWADKCVQVFEEMKSFITTHLYNTLLGVLFKLDCTDKALHIVQNILHPDSECQPNNTTGDIIFSVLLKRNPHRVAEEAILNTVLELCKHHVFPNAFQLTQWVSMLCKRGHSGKAWDVIQAIEEMGGPVEVPSYNALLTGLGRDKDFKRMNLLYTKMKDTGVQPNVVTFSIHINHLCKSRQVDEAMKVLDKMIVEGGAARPDIITFNTVIDGLCKVGRQEEGLVLVEKMRSQLGCSPNAVTYNCLIDGFCKAGAMENSEELFCQMMEEGVQPNAITLNTIVDGMCRQGRISSALEFFNDMCTKGVKGNVVTYSTLIGAFLHVNNVSKAMELFDEMLRVGSSPDAITYFTLISGLSQAGRLEEACSVASSMQKAGFHLDVVSYNNLISGLCRKNRLDKAYEMLKEMEQAGIKPDVATFNTLIAALTRLSNFSSAHQLMTKMVEAGCKPTVVTYGALIHGYCKAGKINQAMEIFQGMGTAGVQPNDVIYTMLIDFLCKGGDLDAAILLMEEMRAEGILPRVSTYNALFKGLRDHDSLGKALELMDQMSEEGCRPDYITMEILTEWLSASGETSRLRKFVYQSEAPN
ncbi:hypothetical protein ACLOJK_009085 [Asimina triloba]